MTWQNNIKKENVKSKRDRLVETMLEFLEETAYADRTDVMEHWNAFVDSLDDAYIEE
tara:strand:- start:136 stop:306 length:171 start_codon:yes stop_codon:yes gene_type:complete